MGEFVVDVEGRPDPIRFMIEGDSPTPEEQFKISSFLRSAGGRRQAIQERTELKSAAQAIGATAGGIGGAVAGGFLGGGPGGALAGGAIGSTGGSIATESAFEAAQNAGLIGETEDLPPGVVSQTVGLLRGQSLGPQSTIRRGVEEGVFDLATGGAITGAGGLKRATMKRILGMNSIEAGRIASGARQFQIGLGTQDVSPNVAVRGFQKVIGRFPFAAPALREAAERKSREVGEAIEERLLVNLGPSVSTVEAGVDLSRGLRQMTKSAADDINSSYALFRRLAEEEGAQVPTNQTSLQARQLVEAQTKLRPRTAEGKVIPSPTRNPTLEFATKLADMEATIDIRSYQVLTQDLDRLASKAFSSGDNAQAKQALDLKRALEQDLENIQGSPEVRDALLSANKKFHERAKLMATPAARRLRSARPESFGMVGDPRRTEDELFSLAFRAGSAEDLTDLHRLVGERVFHRATRAHLTDVFERASHVDSQGRFFLNVGQVRKELGLDNAHGPRRLALQKSLGLSGQRIDIQTLENFLEVSERALREGFPEASTFIARRATLGGVRAAVRGLTLGMVGGAAAAAPGISIPAA